MAAPKRRQPIQLGLDRAQVINIPRQGGAQGIARTHAEHDDDNQGEEKPETSARKHGRAEKAACAAI